MATQKITELDVAKLDYLRETAQRLTTAGHGQKGKIVDDAAGFLSLSRAELYRRLETVGYTSERKTRSDKGKSVVSQEAAHLIGGMVYEATRANGKRTTSIKGALAIAKANGLAPNCSPATIARVMRSNFCHPTMLELPTAHIQQRSLHPNHVRQIDASTCILFYLPVEGGIRDMNPREFNKNKPENLKRIEKDMLTRYVLTDHYSGAIYVEYVRGGESADNLIKVLLNSLQRRSNQDPMHGVPFIIYTDKGSAMTSGLFTNLLERLQIRVIDHKAGNPRAKGQVENTQNIIEREFEGRIKFLKNQITTLEQINTLAWQWCRVFNETAIHTRTGRTRNAVWQTITAEQLRIAPPLELCRELVTTKPETKTVTGYLTVTHTIKGYGNNSYDVRHVHGVHPKAKLEVVVNPYRAPCIDIHGIDEHGEPMIYTIEPQQRDWVGWTENAAVIGEETRSMPDSAIDKAKKQIRHDAYNVDTDEALAKAVKNRQAPYADRIDPMADIKQVNVHDYLPRAGEPLQPIVRTTRELAPLSHIEAAKRIKASVGDLWKGAPNMEALKKAYPENVPAEHIEALAEAIRKEASTPSTTLRVVGI